MEVLVALGGRRSQAGQMALPLIGEEKGRPGPVVTSKGCIFRRLGNNDKNTQSVLLDAH